MTLPGALPGATIGLRDDSGDDAGLTASINTTPLVDIMLVLLIIFLITVPVVTHSVPVNLPNEVNQPTVTKPQNIVIAVDKDGNVYWNDAELADNDALLTALKQRAADNPQPEVHIRADKDARYEFVGRVVVDCQRAGIAKVAFITEPEHGSAVEAAE
jgi:biopolymer transport protein ExbD